MPEVWALDRRAALRLQAARVTTINKSIPMAAMDTPTEKTKNFLAKEDN